MGSQKTWFFLKFLEPSSFRYIKIDTGFLLLLLFNEHCASFLCMKREQQICLLQKWDLGVGMQGRACAPGKHPAALRPPGVCEMANGHLESLCSARAAPVLQHWHLSLSLRVTFLRGFAFRQPFLLPSQSREMVRGTLGFTPNLFCLLKWPLEGN